LIRFCDLTKQFGELMAVDHLEFTVEDGEIFGLLGPNGAGKTTTMKLLLGLMRPSSGTAEVAGHDITTETIRIRELVGYLPEEPFVYDYLSAVDFLSFIAEVRKIPPDTARERIQKWLDFFSLTGREGEYLVNYSQGMRKKVSLASALIHDPPVLILDEPTGGLDPRSVRDLREKILELAADGKTILMSTHVLEVAQKICSRVGIISRGRIVGLGTPDDLCTTGRAESVDLEKVFIELTSWEEDVFPEADNNPPEETSGQ